MAEKIELAKAYVQVIPSTEGIKSKLTAAMNDAGDEAGKSGGSKLGSGLSQGFAAVGKAALAGVTAASVAVGALVTQSVEAYSEYEQLIGGVETLFGEISSTTDASSIVIENAGNAWKTAGMDANTYMETATSFAASLMSSLENDGVAAAAAADQAVTDMADNANKMGTSMESIQNAYQGFAKQNYTMLDNLKLGYGGTKEEMQRLLADAQEFSGVEYDINNLSDVYEAIHVVQTELGITGTTAKEASTTIQGSLSMTSAAWSNLVTGMGDSEADIEGLVGDLVESVGITLDNLIPVAKTALTGVSTMIGELAPVIAQEIPGLIEEVVPGLLEAATTVITTLIQGIVEAGPSLISSATEIILNFVAEIITLLPDIMEAGIEILVALADGISQSLPDLIPTIVDVITQMIQTFADNFGIITEAGLTLLDALVEGILSAVPVLIEALPEIITAFTEGLLEASVMIMEAGIELLMALVEAIPVIIEALVEALPDIIIGITTALIEAIPDLMLAAIDLFMALVEAIPQIIIELVEALPKVITAIVETLVEKAPEIMEAGKEAMRKLIEGIKSMIKNVTSKASEVGTTIKETIASIKDKLKEIGSDMLKKLTEGISNKISDVKAKAGDVIEGIKSKLNEGLASIRSIGSDLITGLWNGINDKVEWIKEKIQGFGKKVIESIKDIFGVHSPSVVFAEIGGYLTEGLSLGISDGSIEAVKSAKNMASDVIDAVTGMNGAFDMNNYGTVITTKSDETLDRLEQIINNSEKEFVLKIGEREFARLVRKFV